MRRYILIAILAFAISCDTKESQKNTNMSTSENPLLVKSTLDYGTPDFTKIKNEHFMPAILEGMEIQNEEISKAINNVEVPTFNNTILVLEESSKTLDHVTEFSL